MMNKSELKQIIKEEIHKVFSEIKVEKPGYRELYADFSKESKDNSLASRFARSMSEALELLYDYEENNELTINDLFSEEMEEIQDGDKFYAGPGESLEFFKTLPKTFSITNNMDEDDKSFEITKTGEDSFSVKLI